MKYLILLCLLIPLPAISDSSVWRVSKSGNELFIGGTIHVLSPKDYPLPNEFEQAYNQAEILVLETDMDALSNPKIQMQLAKKMRYGDSGSLKNELKAETYQLLTDYLNSQKIPIAVFNSFKPSMVIITLTMLALDNLGMAGTGVDLFFNQKASAENKKRDYLESVEKQISLLENMAKGHEDDLILSTLNDLNELSETMTKLKSAWRKGDLAQLEEMGISSMRHEYPALYRFILVERNNNWIPKLEKLLATTEKELVLVGSLHLVGKEGVLEQLKARGYQVTRFKAKKR
ncbi:MAG: TraB/GumN family protein [Methylococcales bacterium]|nr:TraB/GumN family protein [Methylococcales bacterium]